MSVPAAFSSPAPPRALAVVGVAYAAALGAGLATGWALRDLGPLWVAALADVAATLVVFGFSVRHDNSSLYDPYWSVAPVPIVLFWASRAPAGPDLRALLVIVLVTVWGVRLTANWAARWRGLGDEDFRYSEIRARTGWLYWPASLAGIHLLPTLWVFLGLLPTWPALAGAGRTPGPIDLLAVIVTSGGIAIEAVSDLQLRRFLRARRDPSAVLDTGLWGLSRHPNYFGEIAFWWGLWLFGLASDPRWAAWTLVGPASITLLFLLVSIPWMDRRMLSRHPAWAERMKALPAIVPWPRRGSTL
jgi:steroid 5-alpha reductase family enzyme